MPPREESRNQKHLRVLFCCPVVLEAAALLAAWFRPSHIGNYAPGVSITCRRPATPITLAIKLVVNEVALLT